MEDCAQCRSRRRAHAGAGRIDSRDAGRSNRRRARGRHSRRSAGVSRRARPAPSGRRVRSRRRRAHGRRWTRRAGRGGRADPDSGRDVGLSEPRAGGATVELVDGLRTHGEADARMPVEHAYLLVDALRAAGTDITPWIVPGSSHIQAIFDHPDEYESRLIAFFRANLNS